MRSFIAVLALFLPLSAAGALAAGTPVDKLFKDLKAVETPEDAKPIEAQILAAFQRSGSASVDVLMSRTDAALAAGNKDVARHLVDEVTALAPRYAEGWHRRALLQQDSGDDSAALVSLQKAVDLNPRQFEALAELAGMLEDFGQKGEALKLYRRALALDPYLEGLQRHIDGLTRDVEGQGI
jgi:Tfp pilus assembly protein PilF